MENDLGLKQTAEQTVDLLNGIKDALAKGINGGGLQAIAATEDHKHVSSSNLSIPSIGGSESQILRCDSNNTLSWDWSSDMNISDHSNNTVSYSLTSNSTAVPAWTVNTPYVGQYKIATPVPGYAGESKKQEGGSVMNTNGRIVAYKDRTFEVRQEMTLTPATPQVFSILLRGTKYEIKIRYDRVESQFVLWECNETTLGDMTSAVREVCDLILAEEANDKAVKDFFDAENVLHIYQDDGWEDMDEMEEETTAALDRLNTKLDRVAEAREASLNDNS